MTPPENLLHSSRTFTLMGILNVTPDSFSDGGRYSDPAAAIQRGLELRALGADWVDVGGESTRPGSDPVPEAEELRRVLPVIQALAAQGVPISIDTRKAAVALQAVAAGARLVNDVSACADPDMPGVVAASGAFLMVMHMQGEPKNMQKSPHYTDVVLEVRAFLKGKLEGLVGQGIPLQNLAVDPGIGFGKKLEHNLSLMARFRELTGLGVPVAIGASRKSFLGILTGSKDPNERLFASIAAAVSAHRDGARIFRVHDVGATRDALLAAEAWSTHEP